MTEQSAALAATQTSCMTGSVHIQTETGKVYYDDTMPKMCTFAQTHCYEQVIHGRTANWPGNFRS